MAVVVISKIKHKNGVSPVMDAADIEMPDGSRLDAYTEGMMVIAEAVVGQVSSLDAQVKDLDNRLDEFSPGVDEETAERIAALEAQDKTLTEAALATGIRLNKLETPATSVDLTKYESNGDIVETYADGSTKTYKMEFNADGKPTKVTDSDGNVTVLTW